eukprot:gene15061-17261_t
MLNAVLVSQLDFPCFVQVVANYVLAFDAAANQEFDAIVLPRTFADTHYSTDEFLQDVTNVVGFNASIIHTVDHDSADHVLGKTVRSSASGSDGYVVDDLVAAISSAAKAGSLAESQSNDASVVSNEALQEQGATRPSDSRQKPNKHNKRPRDDRAEPMPVSEEQQQCSSKHARYEEQNHRQYPLSADELAYRQWHQWQWHQWQWQVLAQAQALQDPVQGQHFPVRAGGLSVLESATDSSTAPRIIPVSPISPRPPHSHNPTLQHHNNHPHHPYHTHYHTHPLHPSPHPNAYHHHVPLHHCPHPDCGVALPQHASHPEPVPHLHQLRTARADSCSANSATTTLTSSTLSDATEEEAASIASKDLCYATTPCADGLSTVSSDTGNELFDFMNEDLWFCEAEC